VILKHDVEQELRKQFEAMLPTLVEGILAEASDPSTIGLFTTWCSPEPDLSNEDRFEGYPNQTIRYLPKVEIVCVERDEDAEGTTLQ